MNQAKFDSIERGLTHVSRKVFQAVPMREQWTRHQIHAELGRQGVNLTHNVVGGCLDSLRGMGLIREPDRGEFIRVVVRAYQPEEPKEAALPASTLAPVATKPATHESPLAVLAGLSKDLRGLADRIDAAALDVEERIEALGRDTEKLRQLQALLKGLT